MPVAIEFQNGSSDTTIVFENTFGGQIYQTTIGFKPTIVTFDPEIWLLSSNNVVTFDPTLGTTEPLLLLNRIPIILIRQIFLRMNVCSLRNSVYFYFMKVIHCR